MRIIETSIYPYAELSDKAKAKARDWFREGDEFDDSYTLSEASSALATLGYSATIQYSGFDVQGSGACFYGAFDAKDFDPDAVAELLRDRPTDKEMHRIVDALRKVLEVAPGLIAELTRDGYYCTARDVEFSIDTGLHPTERDLYNTYGRATANAFMAASRDLMHWIYATLKSEYEHQISDETVAGNIEANEYEFTADGKVHS